MEKIDQKTAIKGGEFLIRETEAHEIFIPEEWTEEQKMIAQTCRDFLATEVYAPLCWLRRIRPAILSLCVSTDTAQYQK